MSKILQISNDTVSIGMDNGSIKEVPANSLNFMPSVGDEVQIFESGEKTIVTKIEKANNNNVPPQIVINNSNSSVNTNTNTNTNMNSGFYGRPKNKWVAFFLCLFVGFCGVHKFYEGKVGMGILYLFTVGLFGIGILVDLITLLFKPNPYYV